MSLIKKLDEEKSPLMLERRKFLARFLVSMSFDKVVLCLGSDTEQAEKIVKKTASEIHGSRLSGFYDHQKEWESFVKQGNKFPSDMSETPERSIRGLLEMTCGEDEDPEALASRGTSVVPDFDELVIVRDIRFASLCRHHLLPFTGTISVGYIPNQGILLGVSKLPRIALAYAKRLQIQEQLAVQITDMIDKSIKPKGVGVVITSQHACMSCRGIKADSAEMVTSSFRGVFREESDARAEFLSLIK